MRAFDAACASLLLGSSLWAVFGAAWVYHDPPALQVYLILTAFFAAVIVLAVILGRRK